MLCTKLLEISIDVRTRGLSGVFLLTIVVLLSWPIGCKREPPPAAIGRPAPKAGALKSDPFAGRLAEIVAGYRKIIVLLENEDAMSVENRARTAIASKRARNQKLQQEVASARSDLQKLEVPPNARAGKAETSSGHNDLGVSLFKEKKYENALQEFLEAVRLNPSNVQAINNAGFVYYRRDKFAEAVQWFEKTIAPDPNRAIAYVNLGDAYVAVNRKEDARRAYENCIKLLPNSIFAQSATSKLAALNK